MKPGFWKDKQTEESKTEIHQLSKLEQYQEKTESPDIDIRDKTEILVLHWVDGTQKIYSKKDIILF